MRISTFPPISETIPARPTKVSKLDMFSASIHGLSRQIFLFLVVLTGVFAGHFSVKPLAAQETETRTKPHLNLITLGHVDHGKTTVASAITHVLAPRVEGNTFVDVETLSAAAEERMWGVNVTRIVIEFQSKNRHFALYDSPQHRDVLKQLIMGNPTFDGALLVIDAEEGVTLQVHQQLELARQTGISKLVVFIEQKNLQENESPAIDLKQAVESLLQKTGFPGENVPVIPGSARGALEQYESGRKSILQLIAHLEKDIPSPSSPQEAPFLMPVEDVFSIQGRGTVVTGRVERGMIEVGDKVDLIGIAPEPRQVVIKGVEMFRKMLDRAEAGDNVGLLVTDLKKGQVRRGMVLTQPGAIEQHTAFESINYVLEKEEGGRHTPFFNQYRPQFYFRTTDVTGSVELPGDQEMVMPGDVVRFAVKLTAPIALEPGLRYAIREGGRTIGIGVVAYISE